MVYRNILQRGQNIYELGRDMIKAAIEVYRSREVQSDQDESEVQGPIKNAQKKPQKNLSTPDPRDQAELAKLTSMKSHIVREHRPGEKLNTNMWQRNYINHQGN